ncbi:Hypothetical protein POVN_LOCUS16 [uncultured virus]|nr:Hypothetical protein POVN_LOCUS16 [uncultured virus]
MTEIKWIPSKEAHTQYGFEIGDLKALPKGSIKVEGRDLHYNVAAVEAHIAAGIRADFKDRVFASGDTVSIGNVDTTSLATAENLAKYAKVKPLSLNFNLGPIPWRTEGKERLCLAPGDVKEGGWKLAPNGLSSLVYTHTEALLIAHMLGRSFMLYPTDPKMDVLRKAYAQTCTPPWMRSHPAASFNNACKQPYTGDVPESKRACYVCNLIHNFETFVCTTCSTRFCSKACGKAHKKVCKV